MLFKWLVMFNGLQRLTGCSYDFLAADPHKGVVGHKQQQSHAEKVDVGLPISPCHYGVYHSSSGQNEYSVDCCVQVSDSERDPNMLVFQHPFIGTEIDQEEQQG
jgi:hypothetical protein